MKTFIKLLSVMLILAITNSCDQKELCEHHVHYKTLYLDFDWRDAPDADPEGMCVMFYPEDNSKPIRYDFKGMHGGKIDVPEGRYRMLVFNNDTESVQFYDWQHYTGMTLYTREGDVLEPMLGYNLTSTGAAPKSLSAQNERVTITPDMMWGCHVYDVDISAQGVEYKCRPSEEDPLWSVPTYSSQTIIVYPHPLIRLYDYEVLHVHNLKHVLRMSGTLSGMSPALVLYDEDLAEEPVTLPFGAEPDGEERITGQFLTFGHFDESVVPTMMTFYFIMDDGTKYVFRDLPGLDVTQQVINAPNPWHVHLIIDHLDLPEPIEDDSGLRPSVDGWDEEQHDVHMDFDNLK